MYLVISLILLIINQGNFEFLHYDILSLVYIIIYCLFLHFWQTKKNGTMTYLNKEKKKKSDLFSLIVRLFSGYFHLLRKEYFTYEY